MIYIRDGIYTGYIRRQIYSYISVPQVKKRVKIQSINRLYKCQDRRGEVGKSFFAPTKIKVKEWETG